jgi:antitoxin (DNA-binding transcriptional repressor) of toxin-antitoxin stability system
VTIDIDELKEHLDRLLTDIETLGETVEITRRGKPVASIMPTFAEEVTSSTDFERRWSDRMVLAEEIGRAWPEDVSAVDAVRDVRGEPWTEAERIAYWNECDALIDDIAAKAPSDVSAEDVMRDIRRDLGTSSR